MICNPFDIESCAIIVSTSRLSFNKVLNWKYKSENVISSGLDVKNTNGSKVDITVARWHTQLKDILTIGCDNGEVQVFNYTNTTKKTFIVPQRKNSAVADLQWDKLSSVYLLVAYTSFISLWDYDSQSEIFVFDSQINDISCIFWLDWQAGNFASGNERNGTLKLWNVSQKTPIGIKRVGDIGIKNIVIGNTTKQCLCGHKDGSLSLYNIDKEVTDYKMSSNHTETIFDCRMSPQSPDCFATASYDRTVKLWNCSDFSLSKTLFGATDILYSIAWSPSGKMIIASCASGEMILWNVSTGKELARYKHHDQPSFSVTWNYFNSDILCSTSMDKSVVVFRIDESEICENHYIPSGSVQKVIHTDTEIKMRIKLPTAVFGVNFSPHLGNLLCVGCQDGLVRIFNYMHNKNPLVAVCSGHKSRVFQCLWSPNVRGLIASGSDDSEIMIWNVDNNIDEKEGEIVMNRNRNNSNNSSTELIEINSDKDASAVKYEPSQSLVGHTSNVRALFWSTECNDILLTGSWDSKIKVWNVVSGECLQTVHGHVADVYSITSHFERPFTFWSCSRDGTIRLWELEEISRPLLRVAVLECSLDNCRKSRSTPDTEVNNNKILLSGKRSASLAKKLGVVSEIESSISLGIGERTVLACAFYELFNFFCGNNGSMEVWECAIALLLCEKNGTSSVQPLPTTILLRPLASRKVMNLNEIVMNAESDARKAESMRGRSSQYMSEKTIEAMKIAASKYLRVGNFQKYCSIMWDIGHKTEALAVAPSVSLTFWKELSEKYASELEQKNSELCVPFYASLKNKDAVTRFYLNRKDTQSALIFANITNFKENEMPTSSDTKSREATSSETKGKQDMIRMVSNCAADNYVLKGNSILAAAQHLSIGEISSALELLNSCGESELAYSIALCFQRSDEAEQNKNILSRNSS